LKLYADMHSSVIESQRLEETLSIP
jgi:hypothetical protein